MISKFKIFTKLIIFLLIINFAASTTNGNSLNANTHTDVFETRTENVHNPAAATGSSGGTGTPNINVIDSYVPFRSDSHDHFSWQLLKTVLLEENTRNVIISPFSIKLVLALLSEASGANTKTQQELISTQTDIRSQNNLREFYRKTLNAFKKENQLYNTLNFRTKLFTDSFIETQQKYAATLKHYYDTEIERLNFQDGVGAAHTINEWASNTTNGRLRNLVNEQNVLNSVMLLTNIIYFNGVWRRQFPESYNGVFFRTAEQQSRAQFMEQTDFFYFYKSEKLNAKIIRLPYKGKNSMFVLLPDAIDGIDGLVNNLENNELKSAQWMMQEVKVKLTLPKFNFDYNKNLKETLSKLGINEIFTDNASLPGLSRGADVAGKVKVSNIIQKAGIDVNEQGTEAFAATVVEIENKFGGSIVIQEFNVNRPFIFFIEEESTGNILFAGKVLDPSIK